MRNTLYEIKDKSNRDKEFLKLEIADKDAVVRAYDKEFDVLNKERQKISNQLVQKTFNEKKFQSDLMKAKEKAEYY